MVLGAKISTRTARHASTGNGKTTLKEQSENRTERNESMMSKRARLSSMGPVVAALAAVFMVTGSALGHCDTMDGPVVKDAQTAVMKGDVTGLLKWVPQADEDEIRQAFQKTLLVRAKGPEAQELADMYFFETLVRVHRAGEGAPYTGIKPAGTPLPAPIAMSDAALEQGNLDELARHIAAAVETNIRERFAAAAEARKHKDESIESGRKFVAAYVEFVHYVEAAHNLATAHGAHHAQGGCVQHAAAPAAAHEHPQENAPTVPPAEHSSKQPTAAPKHKHCEH